MPSFQSPVPMSGSPCRPTARLASSARAQCSKRVGALSRNRRLEEAIRFACFERRALEKRNEFVEYERVVRCFDILSDRISQPSTIVGYTGSNASTRMRQPPVLHVALGELSGGRAQQVFARQVGPDSGERHAILQLVTKAIGSAGLIEGRAGPNAAGERLVEQPAIEHEVHRAVGSLDLDCAQSLIPGSRNVRFQGVEIGGANGEDRGAGVLARCGRSQKEHDFGHAPWLQFQLGAHRGARVQGRANRVGQR